MMQNLLAIDTSFGKFSIALYSGEEQIAYFESEDYSKQAEMLIPEVEKLLSGAGLAYKDINKIAVCIGPGSFTGLRIGLAAVKGLALTLDVVAIGISSLEAAAIAQGGGMVHLDAKRGEAYFQEFGDDLTPLSEPDLIEYEANECSPLPNADLIAKAALKGLGTNIISPLYIRKPDAKLPA